MEEINTQKIEDSPHPTIRDLMKSEYCSIGVPIDDKKQLEEEIEL